MEPEPEPESDTLARPNQSLSNLVLIPSDDLKFGKKIGSGTYGVVYQAELRGATDVAVKAARGEPDSIDKIIKDLGQEIMQCQRLNHVVRRAYTVPFDAHCSHALAPCRTSCSSWARAGECRRITCGQASS